ncbi:LytTR family DNA-binding domain-containing protein [Virgibacillus sp. C22-A2]|uniref:LytTR family DNA-binding domain-containing protein n=1 Tax=Virgibacillus tibetensis TaxID=3042313 RepID=A0ABU6KK50_9BACI|nr:LytTR family DNA-binding domain-containing protein [Virgibacillus sp. C22-A2]
MEIQVMIAEDEQLAREELIFMLENEKDFSLTPSAETGIQLIELYKRHRPAVIFLDVQMPGMSGVEAAKVIAELSGEQRPLFIFTTAFDEYAVEAFEIEAIDFLLKPYDDVRFQQTIERIRKRVAHSHSKKGGDNFQMKTNSTINNPPSKLLIDDGERMVVLSPESIYYAMPSKRLLEIHTENKVVESRMTLQELENKLQGFSFFRPHRSYLVNLNHIEEITPWFNGTSNITLNDKRKTTIPVSRAARKLFFDMFEN